MEKEEFQKKLGSHVATLREKAGLSQNDLALKSDKDRQSLNRLEKGRINPSAYYLQQLAEQLGVSLKDLLDF